MSRIIMLQGSFKQSTMLLLLLSACSLAFGQHFASYPTNAEYGQNGGIRQYKVTDDSRYSSTDPAIIMTMNTLAANGYGQWTVSTDLGNNVSISEHPWLFSPNQAGVDPLQSWSPNGSSAWLLLGNQIAKPSEKFVVSDATHPGCQPPGVVSGGPFNEVSSTAFPVSACKIAANLNGSVRYVAVEPTNRNSFFIQGLNDERGATVGPPGDQQIRIELNGTAHGTLPNPPIARQIVRKPIFTYSSATTASGGNNHTVINTEIDYRDQFDIAMDKKYLYIVWVYDNSGTTEVWSTAILLSDGSLASGFPVMLDNGNSIRPTVACDVRNNPATPKFTAAWLKGGNVKVAAYKVQAGNVVVDKPTIGGPQTLEKTFRDPSNSSITHGFSSKAFTHARVLVSSVAGSSTPVTSVYARQQDELLFYHALTWVALTDIAWFVDGVQGYVGKTSPNIPFPLPIPQQTLGVDNGCGGVVDAHIIAFANPYDNQSGAYNQFHCLYQLKVTNLDINPLIMVRGADNGLGNNPHGNTATRLLLNQQSGSIIQSDPSSYVGAVNQMGIHVHWRIGSDHHYARDTRSFDEDIEEHTLVTNVCRIADGHTSGAELKDGVKMTVWSDPNYGAVNGGSTTSGMYWQYPGNAVGDGIFLGQDNIGTLYYASTGLALTVGNSAGTSTASLYTMPVCNITKTGSAGTITINPGSVWEYYGTSHYQMGNWYSSNWGPNNDLTINLNGPSTGPTTPNLKIHEGATLWPVDALNADHARIDILYGNSINPINTTPNSTKATGLLVVSSTAILEDSKVNSYLPVVEYFDELNNPDTYRNVVMKIIGISGSGSSSVTALRSTNTDYTNFESYTSTEPSGAGAKILYDGRCSIEDPSPDKVVFDGGSFNRMRFYAINPRTAGLELKNLTLTDMVLFPIRIERTCELDYDNILVSNNTFANHLYSDGFSTFVYIWVDGFNDPDFYGEVNVVGNDFTHDQEDYTTYTAPIYFSNSTGNIVGNIISNYSAGDGIRIFGTSFVPSFSYLCGNYIDKSFSSGIRTRNYQGYVKLCQILGNGTSNGFYMELFDQPKIVASHIANCTDHGIFIKKNSNSTADLTGVHGNGNDYAAFDTIANNGTIGDQTTGAAQIYIGDLTGSVRLGDFGNGTWSNWGRNNIIKGQSLGGSLIELWTQTGLDIGSVDHNFWDNGTAGVACTAAGVISTNITASCANTNPPLASMTAWSGSISCSGSLTIKDSKSNQTLQAAQSLTDDTCNYLKQWMYIDVFTKEQMKARYDTLRMYIERCAAEDDESFRAFNNLDADVYRYAPNDTTRFDQYRDWLISVLYLNTTQPFYYCRVLHSIAGTYQYGKYNPTLAGMAVLDYIRHQPKCYGDNLDSAFKDDSIYAIAKGWDPTNLPPLDSLGLGFLLEPGSVTTTGPLAQTYISSFTIHPNPVRDAVKLQFNLSRGSFATMQIHDVLGRIVWESAGRTYDKGTHEVDVNTHVLPEGTLYARIATGFGEVKTVKLIKE